jgi:hypothetical protein
MASSGTSLDLNLLRVLDALLRDRSKVRAAFGWIVAAATS